MLCYIKIYRDLLNYENGSELNLGSGSSRRAAYDFDLDFLGVEIDKEYFDKQEAAWEQYTAQQSLFNGNTGGGLVY